MNRVNTVFTPRPDADCRKSMREGSVVEGCSPPVDQRRPEIDSCVWKHEFLDREAEWEGRP